MSGLTDTTCFGALTVGLLFQGMEIKQRHSELFHQTGGDSPHCASKHPLCVSREGRAALRKQTVTVCQLKRAKFSQSSIIFQTISYALEEVMKFKWSRTFLFDFFFCGGQFRENIFSNCVVAFWNCRQTKISGFLSF